MSNRTATSHMTDMRRVYDDVDGITVYYHTGDESIEAGNPHVYFDRATMKTTLREPDCIVDVETPDAITEDSTAEEDIAALIELADETAAENDAEAEENAKHWASQR